MSTENSDEYKGSSISSLIVILLTLISIIAMIASIYLSSDVQKIFDFKDIKFVPTSSSVIALIVAMLANIAVVYLRKKKE